MIFPWRCAAITSAVNLTECTVNDVCGARAKVRVDEKNASITLTLPAACDDEDAVQDVLNGFILTMLSLRDDYPDYIEVMEV